MQMETETSEKLPHDMDCSQQVVGNMTCWLVVVMMLDLASVVVLRGFVLTPQVV